MEGSTCVHRKSMDEKRWTVSTFAALILLARKFRLATPPGDLECRFMAFLDSAHQYVELFNKVLSGRLNIDQTIGMIDLTLTLSWLSKEPSAIFISVLTLVLLETKFSDQFVLECYHRILISFPLIFHGVSIQNTNFILACEPTREEMCCRWRSLRDISARNASAKIVEWFLPHTIVKFSTKYRIWLWICSRMHSNTKVHTCFAMSIVTNGERLHRACQARILRQ